MTGENEDVIRRFYDLRAAGDRPGLREILAPDVAWHDPYPPPHGGDLKGADVVFGQIFDAAAELTGGSTSLRLAGILSTGEFVAAVVSWSARYRGKRMEGTELAVYHLREGLIIEAWFFVDDQRGAWEFFA